MTYDCAVVGGGIVGLATAMTLLQQRPGARMLVIEKERDVAQHQTGRNSGVIHSGIYYKPGSLKARMAREGNESMRQFCARHDIPFEV
jgi:(S)-2-hydroxyglutarate dehydrogenase